jgi:hypothetical protein
VDFDFMWAGEWAVEEEGPFTRLPLESRAADDCDYDYDTASAADAAGGHGHLTPAEAALHARERPPMCTPTSRVTTASSTRAGSGH